MYTLNNAFENAYTEYIKEENNHINKLDNQKEVDILNVTPEEILSMETSKPIRDMYKCYDCHHIFDKEEADVETEEVTGSSTRYTGFDNYIDEPFTYEDETVRCPYCGSKDISTLYTDDLDDTIVNVDEYISGFTKYFNEWAEKQNSSELTEAKKLEEDDQDYTKLKDIVKKEMYKYLKDNGIDVEHLVKSGIELESIKSVIDKLLSNYVSTSIADYENQFDKGLSWDYTVDNNDIMIEINDM